MKNIYKKNLLSILVILIFSNLSYGQEYVQNNFDEIVDNYVKGLHEKEIDTIFLYKEVTVRSISSLSKEKCDNLYNFQTYIIWKKFGETYLTKLDNCHYYSVIKINLDTIWKNYLVNEAVIQNEEAKSFQFIEKIKGKEIISDLVTEDYARQHAKIILQNKVTEITIWDFDLSPSGENKKLKNINYEENINLKSKLFLDLFRTTMKGVEKKKYLSRLVNSGETKN